MLDLAGDAAGHERLDALGLLGRLFEHGLRLGERGFARLQFDLEGGGIDAIEHVAGIDVGALLEGALDHDAGHAGADLGDAGRRDAAGQFADEGLDRRLHRDDADLDRHVNRRRCFCFGAGRSKALLRNRRRRRGVW